MNKNIETNIRMVFKENYLPKGFILNTIKYRKDSDIYDETRELIKLGKEYHDCIISYKDKTFPVTIQNGEDIKEKIERRIKENKIEL